MVNCSDITCKYNDNYKCKTKKLELAYCGINTKYQGFQNYLKCKNFEESEEYIRIKEALKDIKLGGTQ